MTWMTGKSFLTDYLLNKRYKDNDQIIRMIMFQAMMKLSMTAMMTWMMNFFLKEQEEFEHKFNLRKDEDKRIKKRKMLRREKN